MAANMDIRAFRVAEEVSAAVGIEMVVGIVVLVATMVTWVESIVGTEALVAVVVDMDSVEVVGTGGMEREVFATIMD